MEELKRMLINVSDSYYDFVVGILDEAKKSESRKKALTGYINNHPKATTSDIVKYLTDELGLYEENRNSGAYTATKEKAALDAKTTA